MDKYQVCLDKDFFLWGGAGGSSSGFEALCFPQVFVPCTIPLTFINIALFCLFWLLYKKKFCLWFHSRVLKKGKSCVFVTAARLNAPSCRLRETVQPPKHLIQLSSNPIFRFGSLNLDNFNSDSFYRSIFYTIKLTVSLTVNYPFFC